MEIILENIKVLLFIGIMLFIICFLIIKFSDFRRCNGYGRIFKQEYKKNEQFKISNKN